LACGTGVTAVAIAAHHSNRTKASEVKLQVPGGNLSVSFKSDGDSYSDVWLKGPAVLVFKGEIAC